MEGDAGSASVVARLLDAALRRALMRPSDCFWICRRRVTSHFSQLHGECRRVSGRGVWSVQTTEGLVAGSMERARKRHSSLVIRKGTDVAMSAHAAQSVHVLALWERKLQLEVWLHSRAHLWRDSLFSSLLELRPQHTAAGRPCVIPCSTRQRDSKGGSLAVSGHASASIERHPLGARGVQRQRAAAATWP